MYKLFEIMSFTELITKKGGFFPVEINVAENCTNRAYQSTLLLGNATNLEIIT